MWTTFASVCLRSINSCCTAKYLIAGAITVDIHGDVLSQYIHLADEHTLAEFG